MPPHRPPKLPAKFRSIKAVAERLDLSPRSVRRLIDDGMLVSYKIGGVVRVSDEDVNDLLARSRITPDEEE